MEWETEMERAGEEENFNIILKIYINFNLK
jgi:hypothetical protein